MNGTLTDEQFLTAQPQGGMSDAEFLSAGAPPPPAEKPPRKATPQDLKDLFENDTLTVTNTGGRNVDLSPREADPGAPTGKLDALGKWLVHSAAGRSIAEAVDPIVQVETLGKAPKITENLPPPQTPTEATSRQFNKAAGTAASVVIPSVPNLVAGKVFQAVSSGAGGVAGAAAAVPTFMYSTGTPIEEAVRSPKEMLTQVAGAVPKAAEVYKNTEGLPIKDRITAVGEQLQPLAMVAGAAGLHATAKMLLTPEGAAKWAAENPQKAAEIAAKEQPLRKDMKDIIGTGDRMSAGQRAEFSKLVKDAIEKPPEPQSLGAATPEQQAAINKNPEAFAPEQRGTPIDREMYHGTSRDFGSFEAGQPNRYGKPTTDKFYFTDNKQVANNFANSSGYRQVSMENNAGDPLFETAAEMHAQVNKAIANGKSLAFINDDGILQKVAKAEDIPEAIYQDGDVRLYDKSRWPKVISSRISGRELDLTQKTIPDWVPSWLKQHGENKISFSHEFDRRIAPWMRENGISALTVPDVYESGFKSTIVLPEAIEYGRQPESQSQSGRGPLSQPAPAGGIAPESAPPALQLVIEPGFRDLPSAGPRMAELQEQGYDVRLAKDGNTFTIRAEPPAELKAEGGIAELAKRWEAESLKTIESKATTLRSGLDPELLGAYVKYGAAQVLRGVNTLADFSKHMVERFGEGVQPHLEDIWRRVTAMAQAVYPERQRPDLNRPTETPAGSRLVEATDALRNTAELPGVRSRESMREEGRASLAADYEGAVERLRTAAAEKRTLNPEETAAAIDILDREGVKALESGSVADTLRAIELANSYRQTRSDQARALGFPGGVKGARQVMTEAIFTPSERVSKAIEGARGDEVRTQKAMQRAAAEVERVARDLRKQGIDPTQLDAYAQNPIAARKIVNIAQAAKRPFSDKLFEYYRNALLSAPITQARNFVSNASNFTIGNAVYRPVEALLNLAVRSPDAAHFRDFKYIYKGVMPGIANAMKNAIESWRTEMPATEREFGTAHTLMNESLGSPSIAIRGKVGRAIRTPQRAAMTADEIMKSIILETEVGSKAANIAQREGLTGDAATARIEQLMLTPNSEARIAAMKEAVTKTYQDKLGKAGQHFLGIRNAIPGARYQIPFVTTLVNLGKIALKKSVLSPAYVAKALIDAHKTGDWSKVPESGADMLVAGAAMLWLMNSNDPKDPWITGGNTASSRGGYEMSRREGNPPEMSMKIGGNWYNYSSLGPVANALAILVDLSGAVQNGNLDQLPDAAINSVKGQIKNLTFAKGLSDIASLLDSGQPSDKIAQWATGFGASWVPNIAKASFRAGDDVVPNRRVWGEGADRRERIANRLLQKTELPGVSDQPAIDVWGRPIKKPIGGLPWPQTDWVWRMMVPMDVRPDGPTIADRAILNFNATADKPFYPEAADPTYKADGKQQYMTDEQYTRFATLAGQTAAKVIDREISRVNADNPTQTDIDVIKDALRDAHKAARDKLVAEWTGKKPESPDDPDAVAETIHGGNVFSQAEKIARSRPIKQALISKAETDAKEAADWLMSRGIDYSDARRTLITELKRRTKSADAIVAAVRRFDSRWKMLAAQQAAR